MQAELVQTTTSDGIALDGAFFAPQEAASLGQPVEAVLLVHGSGGNFYGGLMPPLAARFRDDGYAVASFNTTGHGLVWGAPGRFFGNAHEILDRCRIDLDAAIGWLAERGYRRIGILGHSLGAVKVVYYQAHVQDPRVTAVISVSPVRLSHSYYLTTEEGDEHERNYQQAKELVESGQPDALLEVTFPMPHLFSAKAYIDKHGPEERYDLLRYTDSVRCPLFIIAGSLETHPRLRDFAQDMYNTVQNNPMTHLDIVEDADHGWTEMRDQLGDVVLEWVGRLQPAEAPALGDG
ncbi:MAG: alpha/beta fold hydrolase [Dehalococcoidia bacterium]